MDRNLRYTRQGRQPKSRTSNACEACKRRKTKCSGGPSPCDVCKRADTFCNFNPKLDTRRKLAYNSTTIQDRQHFMLTALLQAIKHSRGDDLQQLISLIRGPSRPDAVATNLRKHFTVLQNKGIIPMYDIDDTDVISFGLQGLCGHRKGKAKSKSLDDETTEQDHSPTATSFGSRDSRSPEEEAFSENAATTRFSSSISIGNDDLFDPVGNYNTSTMLDTPHVDTPTSSNFFSAGPGNTLNNLYYNEAPPAHHFQHAPPSNTRSRASVSDQSNSHLSSTTTNSSMGDGSDSYMSGRAPSMDHQHFQNGLESYPVVPTGSHEYMMQYYHAMANGLPTTLSPSLAVKIDHQQIFPQHDGARDEFSNSPHYAFPPLRSNA